METDTKELTMMGRRTVSIEPRRTARSAQRSGQIQLSESPRSCTGRSGVGSNALLGRRPLLALLMSYLLIAKYKICRAGVGMKQHTISSVQ
jgi:hypothetical protein